MKRDTITTTAAHGLKRGDVVNVGGDRFVVVSTRETSFLLGPMPWWRRALHALRRAWSWLVRQVRL